MKNKGCSNVSCYAYKKKKRFKENTDKCPYCGGTLTYVCKKCYTQLPDNENGLCIRCLAGKEDKMSNIKKKSKSVITGAIAVAGLLAYDKYGKEDIGAILENISDLAGKIKRG